MSALEEGKDQEAKRYRDLLQRLVSKQGHRGGSSAYLLEKKGARVGRGHLTLAEDVETCELFLGLSLEAVMNIPGAVIVTGTFAGRGRRAIKLPLTSLGFLNPAIPVKKKKRNPGCAPLQR